MERRTVEICLTRKELKAIRELAKRDEVSIEKELNILLQLQICEEIELMEAEKAWR